MDKYYVIKESTMDDIANAVREKLGSTDQIAIEDLATNIRAIEGTSELVEVELSEDVGFTYYGSSFNSTVEECDYTELSSDDKTAILAIIEAVAKNTLTNFSFYNHNSNLIAGCCACNVNHYTSTGPHSGTGSSDIRTVLHVYTHFDQYELLILNLDYEEL